MSVDYIKAQIQELSRPDFERLRTWLVAEAARRRAEPGKLRAQAEIVEALLVEGAIEGPEVGTVDTEPGDLPAWVSPGTSHAAMYLPGACVTHNGSVWESTHPGLNHWEPGTTGVDHRIWREVVAPTEPGETPEWVPGIRVEVGEVYLFEGGTYEVVQAHDTQAGWTPTAVPALWKAV